MEIKTIEITKINPVDYNPRKDLQPGDSEYEKLKKSLAEFDCVEPLIWNEATGNLVGGHQRLKVLKEMGRKEVEVSVVRLDEQREKALNLALNKISGEWDMPLLKDLLEEINTGAFDIEITGFDDKEIEELMTQFHVAGEGLTDDDAIPEQVETICKTGDLWQLGNHRLLCGDSTKKEDVARLMGGEKADMVFTDPPYGVDYEGKTKDKLKIKNDKIDDMYSWLYDVFTTMYGFMADGASYYVCCPAGNIHRAFQNALQDSQLPVHQGLVWLKNSMVMGHSDYHYKHEPILYGWKEGSHYFTDDRTQTSVFDVARPSRSEQHPTMKPVELIERAINNSSKVGQIVLDLFGGSGSTLIACEKLSRRCFMMEVDEHYCDVIIKRWEDFTGKKAVKLDGRNNSN